MHCLLLLANGFEDHEALTTRDVLIRNNIQVTTVSITDETLVTTSHGVTLFTDQILKNINFTLFDCLIIPGGSRGVFEGLDNCSELKEIIHYFNNEKKLIACICAGPHIIGKYGILKDKKYTCFPGCNGKIIGGEYHQELGVVKDDNIITGKSMYYTIDFALEIVEALLGKEKRNQSELKLKGE